MADNTDKDNINDLSPVEKRFSKGVVNIALNDPAYDDVGFMPAGLCHVFFPYKDPGDDQTLWIRKHGGYTLTMEATTEYNPETEMPERFGLPFGAKPRMMLALLNTIAIKQQSPELYLGNSLTEFIGKYLHMDTNGRAIREVKNHMARLASADIKIHHKIGENKQFTHSARQRVNIISALDIWWSKAPNQRHFWGNNLRFSDEYYKALEEHGVPLDLRALRAIANKPMAIDLYSFLAHRLHHLSQPLFITWKALKDQFGHTYGEMYNFKRDFRHCLKMVQSVYPDAKVQEDDNKGFYFLPSHPPIRKAKTITPTTEYMVITPPAKSIAKGKKKAPGSGKKTKQQSEQDDPANPLKNALNDLFTNILVEDNKGKK